MRVGVYARRSSSTFMEAQLAAQRPRSGWLAAGTGEHCWQQRHACDASERRSAFRWLTAASARQPDAVPNLLVCRSRMQAELGGRYPHAGRCLPAQPARDRDRRPCEACAISLRCANDPSADTARCDCVVPPFASRAPCECGVPDRRSREVPASRGGRPFNKLCGRAWACCASAALT